MRIMNSLISITSLMTFSLFCLQASEIVNGTIAVNKSIPKSDFPDLAKITIVEAINLAAKEIPGKVTEADLEKDDGFLIYKIKVTSPNGRITELKMDAGNGKVLQKETNHRYED
jgi:uncharacterized membrane protein YkoI